MLVRTYLERRLARFVVMRSLSRMIWFLPVLEAVLRPNGIAVAITIGLVFGLLHVLTDHMVKLAQVFCPSCNKSVAVFAERFSVGLLCLREIGFCPKCGVSIDRDVDDVVGGGEIVPDVVTSGIPARVARTLRMLWLCALLALICLALRWHGGPRVFEVVGWTVLVGSLVLNVLMRVSGMFRCPRCRQSIEWLLAGSLTRSLRATVRYCPFCSCDLLEKHPRATHRFGITQS
jgi:hypothetical protein